MTITDIDVATAVERVRATARTGITRDLDWRGEQLAALEALLIECEGELLDALAVDLGKPAAEAMSSDILPSLFEVQEARASYRDWAATRTVDVPAIWQPATATIIPEPLGVVLVLGPWNYPVQLVVAPLVAALAAGNAVVVKPSELAPATSAVLRRELGRRLDPDGVLVIEGDVAVAERLLESRYDHIFFTGSTSVGRVVAAAAAQHLTPVTLELGGKCPTYVDRDAAVDVAAERIAWTKFLNAGQTCLAPDYVLADAPIVEELVAALQASVRRFYGDDPATSPSYGRIVNERHVDRLRQLRDGPGAGVIVCGGGDDPSQRYIEPTILRDSSPESAIMQEEIFGPLLPVVTIDGLDTAIARATRGPIPLASYVFAEDVAVADAWIHGVPAGGSCVNAAILHVLPPSLPFGGRGDSGMGAYHGKHGFDQLSHHRSVLRKPTTDDLSPYMPPF